jgi:hypothetical protein
MKAAIITVIVVLIAGYMLLNLIGLLFTRSP